MSTIRSRLDLDDRSGWEMYGIAVAAGGFALYTSWMLADIAPRWFVFPVIAVIIAWRLLSRDKRSAQLAYGCYTAAALLVLTPVVLIAPGVFAASDLGVSWWTMVWMEINLVLLIAFALPGILLAYLGARYDDRWEIT